jgi:hypothetical protein
MQISTTIKSTSLLLAEKDRRAVIAIGVGLVLALILFAIAAIF